MVRVVYNYPSKKSKLPVGLAFLQVYIYTTRLSECLKGIGMARKNRTKLLSLDEDTWELALKKPNFSEWVRNQLRSERNQEPVSKVIAQLEKDLELAHKKSDLWWTMLMKERSEEE